MLLLVSDRFSASVAAFDEVKELRLDLLLLLLPILNIEMTPDMLLFLTLRVDVVPSSFSVKFWDISSSIVTCAADIMRCLLCDDLLLCCGFVVGMVVLVLIIIFVFCS